MTLGLVILAAGYSQRMGVLKPLLPLGSESALARAIRLSRQAALDTAVIVTGHRQEDVAAEAHACSDPPVMVVHNTRFSEGMFTSVKRGVEALPKHLDGFFLLPVDHSGVSIETITALITAFQEHQAKAIIYPTVDGVRGHPPLIPMAFIEKLNEDPGLDGMRGYLAAYPAIDLPLEDRGALLDMDTPADYEALLNHLGVAAYPNKATIDALLVKYETPEKVVAHMRHVRAVALTISTMLHKKGIQLDNDLLASSCLLHDVVRSQPDHAKAGAKVLLSEGYPATARLVADHMDLPEGYEPQLDALAILYLADKLSHGAQTAPLEERLTVLRQRCAGDEEALKSAERRISQAQGILALLSEQLGITYQMIVNQVNIL